MDSSFSMDQSQSFNATASSSFIDYGVDEDTNPLSGDDNQAESSLDNSNFASMDDTQGSLVIDEGRKQAELKRIRNEASFSHDMSEDSITQASGSGSRRKSKKPKQVQKRNQRTELGNALDENGKQILYLYSNFNKAVNPIKLRYTP